jgi:amino acid transporter
MIRRAVEERAVNRQIWIFGTLAVLIAGIVWMAVFFTFNTFWLVVVFSVALLYLVFHFRRGSDLWIERWKRRAKGWWEAQR